MIHIFKKEFVLNYRNEPNTDGDKQKTKKPFGDYAEKH
jgi:hypothetical protein